MTIRELAKAAGVSRGTVDRVLHNRKGVAPEIEARIRRIAKEMGYTPNRAGRMLNARKQPLRIGCLLPSVGNDYFDDMIAGFRRAEQELRDFGVSLCMEQLRGYQVEEHLAALTRLHERECAALCISSVDVPAIRSCVGAIVDSGVPVLTVNNDLTDTERLCYVGSDDASGGRTAAGLLSLYVTEPIEVLIVMGSRSIRGHTERVEAFLETLAAKGVPHHLVDTVESMDDDGLAYRLTREALRDNPQINCVYVSAAGTSGACRAIVEAGVKRKGFHVMAFDAVPATVELVQDGIIDFTICQEPFVQGDMSIRLLFDYLLDGKKSKPENFYTDTVIKIKENL